MEERKSDSEDLPPPQISATPPRNMARPRHRRFGIGNNSGFRLGELSSTSLQRHNIEFDTDSGDNEELPNTEDTNANNGDVSEDLETITETDSELEFSSRNSSTTSMQLVPCRRPSDCDIVSRRRSRTFPGDSDSVLVRTVPIPIPNGPESYFIPYRSDLNSTATVSFMPPSVIFQQVAIANSNSRDACTQTRRRSQDYSENSGNRFRRRSFRSFHLGQPLPLPDVVQVRGDSNMAANRRNSIAVNLPADSEARLRCIGMAIRNMADQFAHDRANGNQIVSPNALQRRISELFPSSSLSNRRSRSQSSPSPVEYFHHSVT